MTKQQWILTEFYKRLVPNAFNDKLLLLWSIQQEADELFQEIAE